ncbi:hypothetical protein SAMN04487851_11385 [Prevotella sp. tc2-28]|nr:hypothetical protein SAMN04487851_11385 [Prevotella sp. tc2-28]
MYFCSKKYFVMICACKFKFVITNLKFALS